MSVKNHPLKNNEKENSLPNLGQSVGDLVTALGKGAVGMVPVVGPALAEVICILAPAHRFERIESYVRILADRIEQLSISTHRVQEMESINLFEEGARQAARAIRNERHAQIATLVASGMAGEDYERLQSKRLLLLLSEIDDAELIILTSLLDRNFGDADFYQRHENILREPTAETGASPKKNDQVAVYWAAFDHLERLGLVKAQNIEEEYGSMHHKRSDHQLTHLGLMLLRRAGIAEENEY
jgi:hypothetical protein